LGNFHTTGEIKLDFVNRCKTARLDAVMFYIIHKNILGDVLKKYEPRTVLGQKPSKPCTYRRGERSAKS
jgi:hypothetical protein